MWPASMLIYWNKRKFLHKERVQFPLRVVLVHQHGRRFVVLDRKRQTSDSSWEFLRIENKQIKTVPNDSYG